MPPARLRRVLLHACPVKGLSRLTSSPKILTNPKFAAVFGCRRARLRPSTEHAARLIDHAWVLLALAFTTLCTGCLSDLFDSIPERPCASAGSASDVRGQWRIVGSGIRRGCSDALYEGNFRFQGGTGFGIAQAEDGTLSASEDIEGFSVSGRVEGSCVSLETTERTAAGDVLLRFSGTAQGRQVSGELTGQGPAGCQITGYFESAIE